MPCSLLFPDGVRLAHLDELPGPDANRYELWERIQSAAIAPGFCVRASADQRFAIYVEANVDAPKIWDIFVALVTALVGPVASLIVGQIDNEPSCVGPARTSSLLQLLNAHSYQLTNDGWVQFGIMEEQDASIVEVFVSATKNLKVWSSDESSVRSVFTAHGIAYAEHLQYLDEFPRTTVRIKDDRIAFPNSEELIRYLCESARQLS